jgi:hypothetical protein
VETNAFELLKNSARTNGLDWLNATKIVSYGVVIKVIDTRTVAVETVVRTSRAKEVCIVPLLSPGSQLVEISVEPQIGDLVLLLYQQNFHPSMYSSPAERFEAFNEWSVYDRAQTVEGYTRFSGAGILMRVASFAAATAVRHFTEDGSAIVEADSLAHISATFRKEVGIVFDGSPDKDGLAERAVSVLFSGQNPYMARFWSRAERLHGFHSNADGTLADTDASVTERYSPCAPVLRDYRSSVTKVVGLGTDPGGDAEGAPVETDAPVTETIHGKAPVTRDIRSPQNIVIGIGNDETGDAEEQRDAPVSVTLGEKAGVTVTSKSGMVLHFDKAVAVSSGEGLDLAFAGAVTLSSGGDFAVEFGGSGAFKSSASGLLEIGNTVATLGAMVSELLETLASLTTVGSPAAHKLSPDVIAKIQALKAKWETVFE